LGSFNTDSPSSHVSLNPASGTTKIREKLTFRFASKACFPSNTFSYAAGFTLNLIERAFNQSSSLRTRGPLKKILPLQQIIVFLVRPIDMFIQIGLTPVSLEREVNGVGVDRFSRDADKAHHRQSILFRRLDNELGS
jgi:hypothetical protein